MRGTASGSSGLPAKYSRTPLWLIEEVGAWEDEKVVGFEAC